MLRRGDLPILDFDDSTDDFLWRSEEPSLREASVADLPPVLVVTFLGDDGRAWLAEHSGRVLLASDDINGPRAWHGVSVGGVEVAVMDGPLGAPAVTQWVDTAIRLGIRTVVAVGSCGGLLPNEEGDFHVVRRALRDEGTSYHYLPPSRWVDTDPRVGDALRAELGERGLPWDDVDTWTTDAILRETPDVIAARKAEGCGTVEMECAALAACAAFHGESFGQLLFTADTLAGGTHDSRGWGMGARGLALEVALHAAARLAG